MEGIPTGTSFYIDQTPNPTGSYGTLSGLVNGSNTVFTVSEGSYVSGSLRVYLNGQLQTQGASSDWTETSPSAGTFTFITAPFSGDVITVSYQKSSGSVSDADTLDGYHASAFKKVNSTVVTKTTDYTVSATDETILCNTVSGMIISLPPAVGSGRRYEIKTINLGAVVVSGYSTEVIDGYNTKIIGTIYDNITVLDGGLGTWYIL